jgi:primosomal protein N' (replication factor Y)
LERQAIVLVPEIALTPQTVDRFRAVFGDKIAVLHSALSDGERYDEWLALKEGRKRIAVGAPIGDLRAARQSRRDRRRRRALSRATSRARRHATMLARWRWCARKAKGRGGVGKRDAVARELGQRGERQVHAAHVAERVGAARLPKSKWSTGAIRALPSARSVGLGSRDAQDWLRLVISAELEGALMDRLTKGEQEHSASQPSRVRGVRAMRGLRRRRDLSELLDQPDVSSNARRLVCHYCLHDEPVRPRVRAAKGIVLQSSAGWERSRWSVC